MSSTLAVKQEPVDQVALQVAAHESIEGNVKVIEVDPNDLSESVRLTPTGKVSRAKTRVYTQRYRKEWEHMPDFKDWLTSVPNEPTRAFCKFCQRNLHAHRLSLLKHMCTLKHQRASVQYMKRHTNVKKVDKQDEDEFIEETCEEYDESEEFAEYEDVSYSQEEEEEMIIEEEAQEAVESASKIGSTKLIGKKIWVQKNLERQDILPDKITEEQPNCMSEEGEPIQLEMVVEESDPDDNDDDENENDNITYQKQDNKFTKENEGDVSQKTVESNEAVKTVDDAKKMYIISNGNSLTVVKSQLPHLLINQLNSKNVAIVSTPMKNAIKNKNVNTPASSQELKLKSSTPMNMPVVTQKVTVKKPSISTQVLDISKGIPVYGLQVSLYKLHDGRWTFVQECVTGPDGNCNDFSDDKTIVTTGRYKLHYDVERYYSVRKLPSSYPFIEIVFDIKDPSGSYHTPLLLSPYSYSTHKIM